jgi:hypothetical protein
VKSKLVLIALVCAAPLVLGTAAYLLGWSPGKPGNYGELVPPRGVPAAPFAALRGKWVLVSADAAACDAYCEKKLYFMRQVRRAQGKDMERIERLWLVSGAGAPRAELLAAIEGTRVVALEDPTFTREHIYLVDPLGNLILRFPRDPDPSRMIKDLQRLLRYSRSG